MAAFRDYYGISTRQSERKLCLTARSIRIRVIVSVLVVVVGGAMKRTIPDSQGRSFIPSPAKERLGVRQCCRCLRSNDCCQHFVFTTTDGIGPEDNYPQHDEVSAHYPREFISGHFDQTTAELPLPRQHF
jgi:hypothetical protein